MKNRARYNRSSLIPEPSPPARQLYPPSGPDAGSIRALLVDSDGSSATLEFRGLRTVDAQPLVNTWENVEPQFEKEQDARQDSFRSYVKHWSEIRRQDLVRCGGRKVIFLLFNSLFTSVFLAILLFTVFVYTHSTPLLTTIHLIRPDLLFLMTMISGLATFVGLLGFLGAFLHRKGVISTYDILLWLVLGGCVAIGYMAFHDEHGSGYETRLSARWEVYGNWRGLVQTRYGKTRPTG
ncbi:hypothetical protein HDU85_007665 [Gaertneriomyces sp. JEL0708]|nr:hypothetical protein HDU85_007665 [Gaertneriomyces sp. JEL0708]